MPLLRSIASIILLPFDIFHQSLFRILKIFAFEVRAIILAVFDLLKPLLRMLRIAVAVLIPVYTLPSLAEGLSPLVGAMGNVICYVLLCTYVGVLIHFGIIPTE